MRDTEKPCHEKPKKSKQTNKKKNLQQFYEGMFRSWRQAQHRSLATKIIVVRITGYLEICFLSKQKNTFFYFPKFLGRATVADKRAVDTDDTGEAWKGKLTAFFKERRCLMCPGVLRMDEVYNLVIFGCLRTQAPPRSRIYVLLSTVPFP